MTIVKANTVTNGSRDRSEVVTALLGAVFGVVLASKPVKPTNRVTVDMVQVLLEE